MANQVVDFTGILMYRKEYRERDLLVKFATQQVGKRMFFIRGARKRGFKMMADLLPFTYGGYVGDIRDKGLSYIKTAKETSQFMGISNDIVKNAYATYIMSLVDLAIADNELLGGWYNRLFQGLTRIDQGLDAAIIANIFEVQLLELFGVAPNLQNCVVCGGTIAPFDYSESLGGLLCRHHLSADPHRMHLDQRTIYYLRQFSRVNLANLNQVSVRPETKINLRAALDTIYADTVGVYPKSKRFIDQLDRFGSKLS